jgi:uncharacterized protein (DUF58 family)
VTGGFRLTATGASVAVGAPALLLAGAVLRYATLAGLGAAGFAALVLAVGYVAARPRLSVTRTVSPNRVTVGGTATGTLRIAYRGRLRPRGLVAVESVDGRELAVPVPPLRPGDEHELTYPIPAPYRGLVRLGPVVLRRSDPLGLLRRDAPLAGPEVLWVRPATRRVPAPPVGVALDFEGRLTDASPHGSTAFAALRGYVPGDDPRYIHWRSTARLGELVVREHVDTTEPSMALVLDARSGALTPEAFETAVEVCASVALAARRAGHDVALAATGEDRLAVAAQGGVDLMDRLAAVTQRPGGDPEDPTALVRLADGLPSGGCLLVVSGTSPALSAALARLRRRFSRVLVVQCGQSGSAAALRRPGMTVIQAQDSAAAARVLRASLGGVRR